MPMLAPRYADWPERLAAVLQTHQRTPFAWGEHDCCLFAAGVVQALTGVDPATAWRGTYNTDTQAQALIDAAGGLLALATVALGAPRDNPALAQRGDVVCAVVTDTTTQQEKWMLGVATGAGWCAPGLQGLVHRRMSDVVAAWSI